MIKIKNPHTLLYLSKPILWDLTVRTNVYMRMFACSGKKKPKNINNLKVYHPETDENMRNIVQLLKIMRKISE